MALLKKLALSKVYLRGANIEQQYEDELQVEDNLIIREEANNDTKTIEVLEGQPQDTAPKKKRAPTKYNIFMKERLSTLAISHPHLTGKERFTLSVSLWNEQKKTNV